jgi:glycosyltransferase involved in cell wall biosynthesis
VDRRGPKLVSISLKLPYEGVDHAGGELLLHHYRTLAERCERLDAFAIEAPDNLPALRGSKDVDFASYHPQIISLPRWRKTIVGKVLARFWRIAFPVFPDIGACLSFTASESLRERVRCADVVELQWFEYFFFARFVKRINPSADLIGFVHDVPSQRIQRRLSRYPLFLRNHYLRYVEKLERKMLASVRTVTVLSLKDAALLSKVSQSVDPVVLDPPLDLGSIDRIVLASTTGSAFDASSSFGFVGALHRPENNDAALWLLGEIWPAVLASCPMAKLYIIGSKPSDEVQAAAKRHGGSVIVTGYVADIDSFYDFFGTVVIPLRYGAGVKFKTIAGILAGKNIVATPTAIEGTLPGEYFFNVSEDAASLADAMVDLVGNPNGARDLRRKARDEVGSRYSLTRYKQTVANVYRLNSH